MLPTRSGSLRLFRIAGIEVFIHWSWFLVAWYILSTRRDVYGSWGWNVAEYLGLFLIVLLHEFGHVLACRQVGGVSNEIVLWPLGGVALGRPPPRPGAELWTIAAGPLVNVVLWPVLMVATSLVQTSGVGDRVPQLVQLLATLWYINKLLLLFNILPIYPLDGGQILRSLLWYRLGRGRSLQVATIIGFVGIAAGAAWRLSTDPEDWMWTAFLALFLGSQCLGSFRHAQAILALEQRPRHADFACPACGHAPPSGPIWRCQSCGHGYDVYSTRAVCPHCLSPARTVPCLHCGAENPFETWQRGDATNVDSRAERPDV